MLYSLLDLRHISNIYGCPVYLTSAIHCIGTREFLSSIVQDIIDGYGRRVHLWRHEKSVNALNLSELSAKDTNPYRLNDPSRYKARRDLHDIRND
jgi:hypothetical protein